MATGAGLVLAVQLELFADGLGATQIGRERLDIGRRRRGRCAQNIFQQPHTAHDGRGVDAVGGGGHHGGHGEDAASARVVSEHADHAFAGHIVAVVHPAGNVGIEVRVIGMDEGGNAFVAHKHVSEKRSGLLRQHRLHSAVVIKPEWPTLLRRHFTELVEPQPGGGEVLHEGLGLGILQHALHLRTHHGRLAQFVFGGEAEECLVGHRRPQEITKARGQRVGVEVAGVFAQVQKARRTQQRRVARLQGADGAGFVGVAHDLLRRGLGDG